MRPTAHRTMLLALVAFLGMGVGWTEEAVYTLETSTGTVAFKRDGESVALSRVSVSLEGRVREWVGDGAAIPIWTVELQDRQGQHHQLTSQQGTAAIHQTSKTRLVATWTDLMPGDVKVVMTLSVRKQDLLGRLAIEVKGADYALWDVTFPEVGPVALSEQTHSIVPYGWGLLHPNLLDRPLDEGVYPSGARAMPFLGVSDGSAGLYVGLEDAAGYPVRSFVGRRADRPAVSLGLRHEVKDIGLAHRYRSPYDVVLTPYAGDWYEAGQIYRRSAAHSKWGKIPPLSQRRDMPAWLLETGIWYLGGCHDDAGAQQVIDFAHYFDVPTAAHVYNWHEIPFDNHYPEYFPSKPGFTAAVAKVQAEGIAVMPYINGRLWDSGTDSWKEQHAEAAAALDEHGGIYKEVYGTSVPLSPMCPSTELWQQTVTHLLDRLFHEVGVRGVYVDQISAAPAQRCFATNHGHPRGGGTSWIQGYRTLLKRAQRVQPKGTIVTTEENADPWNDLLQAFLMVNTRAGDGDIVPLYPAVYGGRVVSFGLQYFEGPDFVKHFPLRLKLARTFVFGSQLGWIGTEILAEANRTEAAFLKTLCRTRQGARDALQFGQMLAPPGLTGGGVVRWADGPEQQPAVLGSLWLTPKGRRCLAVANIADDARTITLRLDARHLGPVKGPQVVLHPRAGAQDVELVRTSDGAYEGALSLAGLDAQVLECLL